MVLSNLIEMSLTSAKLLLGLFFHNFEVKAKEALYSGNICCLKLVKRLVKGFEGLKQPLVELRPLGWKVILYKNCND